MRDLEQQEAIMRLSTSERLRMVAQLGATVMSWGDVYEDSAVWGEGVLKRGAIPVADDPDTVREHIHITHQAGRWAKFGFNVFELSEDLAASLLLTEPAPLGENEELHLPFPCFFIRLPPGIIPVFVRGEQFWADGIWCHRFTSFHFTHGAHTGFFRWTVERKGLAVWKDRFPTNLDDPVDQAKFNPTWDGDPPSVPEDDISTSKALRIIKNLCSWLDATGGLEGKAKPEPPRVKKKGSKERRKAVEEGTWPRVWLFGKDVRLRPELRKMATEFALVESKKHAVPGWKVRVQHVVRGHFKNQPHGEGRALRKRKWIEPYWRGPEGAAAWAHIYEAAP